MKRTKERKVRSGLRKKARPSTCIGSPEREDESFYERIVRFGYGPPDGPPQTKSGWRKYFDEMSDERRYQLITTVFGHVIPGEWEPMEIRVDWLDGVDKELTSRSHAFARCPHYQHMWQNGYGPPGGDSVDIEAWDTYMDDMPEDKRSDLMDDLFSIARDPVQEAKLWETYVNQVEESQGFDVDVHITDGGTILPMYYDIGHAKHDERLINYSAKAMDAYNEREGTDYAFKEVVKACHQAVGGVMYYITFQGINSEGHIRVFQAKVQDHPNAPEEICNIHKLMLPQYPLAPDDKYQE